MKFLLIILLLSSHAWAEWSVATYNIRNFDNDPREGRTDVAELGKIIKSFKSDVMAFEEVVNVQAFNRLMSSNLPGHSYSISKCGGFGQQKLALAYDKKKFDFVSATEDMSFTGSTNGTCGSLRPVYLVTLRHKTLRKNITFGLVHLKAGGSINSMQRRWVQYDGLVKLASRYSSNELIVLGDFNSTGYNIKDQDYNRFEDLLSDAGLKTTSESIGCSNYWFGTLGGKEFESSILDHIVVQNKSMRSVSNVRVGAHCAKHLCQQASPQALGKSFENVSDHCPIQVTFK